MAWNPFKCRVAVEGVMRTFAGEETEGEWAEIMVGQPTGPTQPDLPFAVYGPSIASSVRSRWTDVFANTRIVSTLKLKRVVVRNLLTGDEVESVGDVFGGLGSQAPAPQAAVLVLGRTADLGHQTRKWVPGWAPGATIETPWKPVLTGPHVVLLKSLLQDYPAVGGMFGFRPECPDWSAEVTRPIVNVAVCSEWRTIRRRSLRHPEWL